MEWNEISVGSPVLYGTGLSAPWEYEVVRVGLCTVRIRRWCYRLGREVVIDVHPSELQSPPDM